MGRSRTGEEVAADSLFCKNGDNRASGFDDQVSSLKDHAQSPEKNILEACCLLYHEKFSAADLSTKSNPIPYQVTQVFPRVHVLIQD